MHPLQRLDPDDILERYGQTPDSARRMAENFVWRARDHRAQADLAVRSQTRGYWLNRAMRCDELGALLRSKADRLSVSEACDGEAQ